jgi:hypothetical protein
MELLARGEVRGTLWPGSTRKVVWAP